MSGVVLRPRLDTPDMYGCFAAEYPLTDALHLLPTRCGQPQPSKDRDLARASADEARPVGSSLRFRALMIYDERFFFPRVTAAMRAGGTKEKGRMNPENSGRQIASRVTLSFVDAF